MVDKELYLAGFDLNEDSKASVPDVFNATLGTNLTTGKPHSVELMGLQCEKECYAISIATALTFLAGIYQVKKQSANAWDSISELKATSAVFKEFSEEPCF